MRKRHTVPIVSVIAVLASTLVAAPAGAHGYVSSPPSRQAMCAQGTVSDCGDIQWEPQSVEAPKGSLQCNGGGSRFSVLNDNTRYWPATAVGDTVTFTWVFTARHRTSNWEYLVDGTRIAVVDGFGQQPPATLSHTISLGGRTGRVTVLARWNIYDTVNAFYSCVDLQIGGGTDPSPTPTPTASPTATASPTPTSSPTGGTWAAGTAYAIGDIVTYAGLAYRCIQAHTALPGWEPPNVPALWQRI